MTCSTLAALQVRINLAQRLRDSFHIILEDVSLTNISFGPEYTAAVESKQVAQQQAERARYQVERAKQDKKSAIIKAEGEAKYDPVKAEKAWRDFKEHFPDYEMYELNFGKEAGDERKPEEKLVDALQKQAAKDAGEWEASTAES